MRKIGVPALALAALLLTGCSAAATPDSGATVQSAPEPATEPTRATTAPLVAESADPPADADGSAEAQFVNLVRDTFSKVPQGTQIPDATDAQLVEAGQHACEQLAADPQVYNVRVVDGEQPDTAGYYNDSAIIAGAATKFLCTSITPQYN